MTIELKVYNNGDHTCLVWLPSDEKAIPDCRGFTIHRTLKPNGGGQARDSYLHGFVGFSDADKLDPTAPWKFPLQRYMWWDYLVDPGDVVQYSVVPVVGPDQGRLSLSLSDASAQTPPMTITGQASAHVCAYFNRGIVSAQWVARALATVGKSAKLDSLIAEPGNALRNACAVCFPPQLLEPARRRQKEWRRDLRRALRAERSGIDPAGRGARAEMPPYPRQRRLQFEET